MQVHLDCRLCYGAETTCANNCIRAPSPNIPYSVAFLGEAVPPTAALLQRKPPARRPPRSRVSSRPIRTEHQCRQVSTRKYSHLLCQGVSVARAGARSAANNAGGSGTRPLPAVPRPRDAAVPSHYHTQTPQRYKQTTLNHVSATVPVMARMTRLRARARLQQLLATKLSTAPALAYTRPPGHPTPRQNGQMAVKCNLHASVVVPGASDERAPGACEGTNGGFRPLSPRHLSSSPRTAWQPIPALQRI